MTIPYEIRICRFCGESAHRSRLLKYGTRAYAHFQCFAENKTIEDSDRLPEYERLRLVMWRRAPDDAPWT